MCEVSSTELAQGVADGEDVDVNRIYWCEGACRLM